MTPRFWVIQNVFSVDKLRSCGMRSKYQHFFTFGMRLSMKLHFGVTVPVFIFIKTQKHPNWVEELRSWYCCLMIFVITYHISFLHTNRHIFIILSCFQSARSFFFRLRRLVGPETRHKACSGKWRLWIGTEVEATRAGLSVSTWQKGESPMNRDPHNGFYCNP